MSGGVDSSVAAALLLEQGFDVVGCFMRLGSPGDTLADSESCDTGPTRIGRGCCSVGDAADARQVAATLGIPFYVCNFRDEFARIMDYFAAEYAAGRTPNPCVRCNDWLKFGKLRAFARTLGIDRIASGHYARVERRDDRCRLLRGLDHNKDQSYVLFGVEQTHLEHMMLPIGAMRKADVRARAHELGLVVHDKPDSQEICFVPDGDYASLVEQRRPDTRRTGQIRDMQGRVLGSHDGQHRFTVGQRRGLGVALGYPIYVVHKDPCTNTVIVGGADDLGADACIAGEANWFIDPFEGWRRCYAQHRYNSPAVPARVRQIAPGSDRTYSRRNARFEVRFDEPERAVTEGQAIVLYDRDHPEVVLGGGWIETVERMVRR
ncbi:MAG: tRNA 2-thiouridine(34) synthase MnmA [Phycisphaerales bacterium]